MRPKEKKRIDVIISNNRHHVAIFRPVVERLSNDGVQCRVLSLCGLRGLPSPERSFTELGVSLYALFPHGFRRSASDGAQAGGGPGRGSDSRRRLRAVVWAGVYINLRRRLLRRPDAVLLANDAAFPYDRICAFLRRREIPFVLFQEGIRFELPNESAAMVKYGGAGASAIAAWGTESAHLFVARGADPRRVHVTGTPRFDDAPINERQHDAHLSADRARGRTLLFLSNPIDDQGFCSTAEKMALIHRFLTETQPLFEDPDFRVLIRLHARESQPAFEAVARACNVGQRINIVATGSMRHFLSQGDAAVVFASTAGLEVLLDDLPLGVLEIPGHGFAHDYVSAGAAVGLSWSHPLAPQLKHLLTRDPERESLSAAYVARNVDVTPGATERTVELVKAVIGYGQGMLA